VVREKYKYIAVFISAHGGMRLVHKPNAHGGYVLEHHIKCCGKTQKEEKFYSTFALLDKFNIEELRDVVKIFVLQVGSLFLFDIVYMHINCISAIKKQK